MIEKRERTFQGILNEITTTRGERVEIVGPLLIKISEIRRASIKA